MLFLFCSHLNYSGFTTDFINSHQTFSIKYTFIIIKELSVSLISYI